MTDLLRQWIAFGGLVLGLIAILRAITKSPRDLPLGECPACKARLDKNNMSDGPCLDGRFYCKSCLMSYQCGCDASYYWDD